MEKISFDSGIKTYKINGSGVLRFNPGDPNVYARFLEAADTLRTLEKELAERAGKDDVIALMVELDGKMKATLGHVFGEGNDFDKMLEGVNLLAVAGNGQRVITNLVAALEPVLVAGAKACAGEQAAAAVEKAKARRGQK